MFGMFSICVSAIEPSLDLAEADLDDEGLAELIYDMTEEERDIIKEIYLDYNSDITSLRVVFENFKNLEKLTAVECNIDDLSGINNVTSVIRFLELSNNEISDVTPLGDLGYAIQQLVLANNKISNYEPLIIEDTGSNTHIYGLLDLSDNYISNTDLFSYLSVDEGLDEDLLDLNDSLPQLFFNSYDSITQTTDDVIQTIIDQTILNYMVDLVDDVNLDVLKTAIDNAVFGI